MSDSLWPHGLYRLYPARILCPWNSPGKNTGVGCHFLLQGIFLTQGSNPGLLHSRQILYRLNHQGISSMSLLNISCIFSILVSCLFICNSILFSRFWIIFTIIILNFLSGRLSISSSFVWFGGHWSCSFTSWVFLCLFILFRLLCLGWSFHFW